MEVLMYTIKDVMDCLKLNEPMVRKLLIDAGAKLDENVTNPDEVVSKEDIVNLWLDRIETREGRLLSKLLEEIA